MVRIMDLSRRRFTFSLALTATGVAAVGCAGRGAGAPTPSSRTQPAPSEEARALDPLAERYVTLVLALGRHDPDYVDAYYGPASLRAQVDAEALSLPAVGERAAQLLEALANCAEPGDPLLKLRHRYLARQTASLGARVSMVGGQRLDFDAESEALYDARAPAHHESEFERVHEELVHFLPGQGSLAERLGRYRQGFVITPDKLRPVFEAAIAEARRRTAAHIPLPTGEHIALEFVTGKPWSGYNWYLGNAKSLVQINTDLPIFAIRAVDVGAHESYPGHHLYNALLEQHLVRGKGFVELSVYALYSPQSLIAEGSANYGIEVAFPDRAAFLRDALFPIGGLPPAEAERYVAVETLHQRLGYVDNEAARRFLDGHITREQAQAYLVRYGLHSPERAAKFMSRIEVSRSYVINYNYGRDLIADYVARQGGHADAPDVRWAVFRDLLASPRLPADLR